MSDAIGPQLPFSEKLHAKKYRGPGETFRESQSRVANALKDSEAHYQSTRDVLLPMRYLFGGRIQSSMGALKSTTAHNCFVAPTIQDSFVHGENSIMEVAAKAAATMRLGGGIGYDFSTLRPRGSRIVQLESQSSGPVSFMGIFNEVCECVASSGHRRGAQMGTILVSHPDIELFIRAKHNTDKLNGFNLSIAITDKFMNCVKNDLPFPLEFAGVVHKEIRARDLWELIMRSTWDWAEPGVIFIDTINRMNNLWYCEHIATTNPCGEQPLPPNGACLLGSYNLVKYIDFDYANEEGDFDYAQLKADIPLITRAMDNVIDRTLYPLKEQELEAKNKRRMGIGITGLANALEAQGARYGDEQFIWLQREVMQVLRDETYRASIELAKEKGAFPLFDRDKYMQGEFIKTLPEDIQEGIYKYGIRNSHLISVAPTGTISSTADNVSSGAEPVFSYEYSRAVEDFNGKKDYVISDYAYREWGIEGKRTKDVTIKEHIAVLSEAYKYVDSAVSKTCNIPSSTSWEEFKNVYWTAHENGCKGCTTYRIDGKRGSILTEIEKAEENVDEAYEAYTPWAQEEEDEAPLRQLAKLLTDDRTLKYLNSLLEYEEPKTACYLDPVTGKRECE